MKVNHDKTFSAIEKLKDVEIELHRLKNALELANKGLDTPSRKWVGLTDEERCEIERELVNTPKAGTSTLVNLIEAKLKEKNT